MGLLSDAAGMARGRVAAVFLTAALPLVPACLVAGGVIRIATAHAQAQAQLGSQTRGEAFAERSRELPPDASAEKKKDILLQAKEPGAPRPRSVSFAIVGAALLATLVLLAGVFLAQGMLLHVAAGGCDSALACRALATRFSALAATTGAAVALTAIGFAACVLPGLVTALMVSLSAPVAVAEGRSGFSAVQRSWDLMKRVWPAQLGLLLCGAILLLIVTQGLGRMLPPRALPHALLDALAAVVVLPLPAFASVVLYLRERAAAEGKPVEEVRQYIRRMSAPG
jgi:hypothetical protein